jgi:hypothetical protein
LGGVKPGDGKGADRRNARIGARMARWQRLYFEYVALDFERRLYWRGLAEVSWYLCAGSGARDRPTKIYRIGFNREWKK